MDGFIICRKDNNGKAYFIDRTDETKTFYDNHYDTVSKMGGELLLTEYKEETIKEFVDAVNNGGFCLVSYLAEFKNYPDNELIELLRMYFVGLKRYKAPNYLGFRIILPANLRTLKLFGRTKEPIYGYLMHPSQMFYHEIFTTANNPNNEVFDWILEASGCKVVDWSKYLNYVDGMNIFISLLLVENNKDLLGRILQDERFANFKKIHKQLLADAGLDDLVPKDIPSLMRLGW